MANEENKAAPTNTSRASNKRAFDDTLAAASSNGNDPLLKRVVLGELTNLEYVVGSTKTNTHNSKHKIKLKKTAPTKRKKIAIQSFKSDAATNFSPNDDLQKCAYAPLIYQHLHSLEVEARRRPLSNYMEKVQNDVTPTMRMILVDWLVEVADEYKLVSDTLYLTVTFVDRFLSSHVMARNSLQLLGVSCMLVASKYEEISPPHVEDFCYITDNTYTGEEVVNMERDLLNFLNFEISNPTTKTFLRIFTKVSQDNVDFLTLHFEFLGCYLAELSLLDYSCVRFLPSAVAASAIFLSRFTLLPKVHPWNLALQHCTGYKPSELKDCVLVIHELQSGRRAASVQAVRKKYMDHKYKCVAALHPPDIPACFFDDA
ncbi:G2/mitotic-specific cyclin C13-1-like [Nicotiana tabacum]|uniref:A-type cyclin n=2 Tax=Nicotiana TaxID=4085 RepID=O04399_TOBAC|nr:G2/mitotic-specific cyclin C13-1-like [Nicotiana tabacum]XP_009770807.1 PREDICTED: G2/mitotic-specific cyclin C13-1-like [Nicotiana sylvestris]BAA20426.1 A-type cyclin [Nicotiana tabacum]